MDSTTTPEPFYKCRKCRRILFLSSQLANAHGGRPDAQLNCGNKMDVFFLREEEAMTPDWVRHQVDLGEWTKGKLFCPHCNGRIGSYDFVGGNKCNCGLMVLPGAHVVAAKLDVEFRDSNMGGVSTCALRDSHL